MSRRCRAGDVAVFVRCVWPENIGKFVDVLDRHRCDPGEWRVKALGRLDTNTGPCAPGAVVWAYDADLKPLRDGDGADETLTWAGKPQTSDDSTTTEETHPAFG